MYGSAVFENGDDPVMADKVQIGKVKFNFDHYKGMDLYCDGDIEDVLLDIVKNNDSSKFQDIIEEKKNWPVMYHLSEQRANIIDWIPMNGSEKVLEVGSGCGAITGTLSSKAGSVTCVDLSKKRSEINAYRNKDSENVTIHVGNFKDIEPDLDKDFDYIFLIGVFEYGQGYIGGEHPYEKFLSLLKKHLKSGGRMVIAIENRLGLKYFAGCKEDHLGTYFSGIEGYGNESVARTFTRNGLIDIFKSCGMNNYHFYYPYPDYKFTTMLHSDRYLPKAGELFDNVRNYDRNRMTLFNEKHAYDGLIEDGMYPEFANSFEVILGPDLPVLYSKFSNDRAQEFKIRTDIVLDHAGRKLIKKNPMTEAAKAHVKEIFEVYEALRDRFSGSDVAINDCTYDEKDNTAIFSFVNGVPLSEMLDKCIDEEDKEGFKKLFDEYLKRTGFNEKAPVADYDLIFPNILVNGSIWTIIDYEWTYGKSIPVKEIAFRALYCFLEEDEKRRIIDADSIYKELGLSSDDIKSLLEVEANFQKYVTGNHLSMVEMWKAIGMSAVVPEEMKLDNVETRVKDRIQLYYDYGEDFTEENSEYPEKEYDDNDECIISIPIKEQIRKIRLDPAMGKCIVTFKSAVIDGKDIFDDDCMCLVTPNGEWISDDSIVFDTEDPWIMFDFTVAKDESSFAGKEIELDYTMILVPDIVAGNLSDYQKA